MTNHQPEQETCRMTDTTITPLHVEEEEVHIDVAFDRNAAETIEVIDGDTDRIAQLKHQLTVEISARIGAVEAHLETIDQELAELTDLRRRVAARLKELNGELERITGDRTSKPERPATSETSFPCPEPSCGKTFVSKQGASTHHTRSHKKAATPTLTAVPPPAPVAKPTAAAATRTVYRCGELIGDGVCGHEVRNPADLSHHTLTAHRRQPTPGEKILVTPDR
jgi:hypothetical protein